jgi:hypothetical protein
MRARDRSNRKRYGRFAQKDIDEYESPAVGAAELLVLKTVG